MERIKRNQA
jgi:hypothetical protein